MFDPEERYDPRTHRATWSDIASAVLALLVIVVGLTAIHRAVEIPRLHEPLAHGAMSSEPGKLAYRPIADDRAEDC